MAKPITASSKALQMRGYDDVGYDVGYDVESAFEPEQETYGVVPSTVPEYTSELGTKRHKENDTAGPLWQEPIKGVYNVGKFIAEEALTTIPLAERMLGLNTYDDQGKEYSGFIDYWKNLGSTSLVADDFVKISKDQADTNMMDYLNNYLNDFVLDESTFANALAEKGGELGYNLTNIPQIEELLKSDSRFQDMAKGVREELNKKYMIAGQDVKEDDDYIYIKNFAETPMGANVSWTRFNDLQLPNLGIYKINDDGQGVRIANSAVNVKGSSLPGASWLGEQGFGQDQTSYQMGDFEMYGSPVTQGIAAVASLPASVAAWNPAGFKKIFSTAGKWGKTKQAAKATFPGMPPSSKKGWAATAGIAGLPVASYHNPGGVFGE